MPVDATVRAAVAAVWDPDDAASVPPPDDRTAPASIAAMDLGERLAWITHPAVRWDVARSLAGGDAPGHVPALRLEDGSVLTEGPAIVQYIADLKPEAKLAPPNGTIGRYRLQEALNFISSEVHKAFGPLFDKQSSDDAKARAKANLTKRFDYLEGQMKGRTWLVGDGFTVADGAWSGPP